MTCFRYRRGSVAALLLLPLAALMIGKGDGPALAAGAAGEKATSLSTSDKRVRPNEKVTVRGRFRPMTTEAAPAGGGTAPIARPVRIQFRALGAKHWRDVSTARAGEGGRFSERLRIGRSGRVRAVSADGRATVAKLIRVRSVTHARVARRARVGRRVAIRGRVAPAGTRRRITVSVDGDRLRTRTNRNGRFRTKWKPRDAGHHRVRVRAAGNRVAAGSAAGAGRVTVYRPAGASWYGPGLYGNGTACGGRLKPSTIGVAHKTMPCGTKLTIRYRGRQVKARVIDRGPYVPGREFDLTEAAKNRLGMGGVATILVDR